MKNDKSQITNNTKNETIHQYQRSTKMLPLNTAGAMRRISMKFRPNLNTLLHSVQQPCATQCKFFFSTLHSSQVWTAIYVE